MSIVNSEAVDPRFDKPNVLFFGIGGQKCGTTWLSDYLRDHPQVCMPDWKEHNYWNVVAGDPTPGRNLMARKAARDGRGKVISLLRDIGWTHAARRHRGARRALLAASKAFPPHSAYADSIFARFRKQHRAAGEISPMYAHLTRDTFMKMSGLAADVRFVFVMRDPVSRFVSGVLHDLKVQHQLDGMTDDSLKGYIGGCLDTPDKRGALSKSRYELTMAELEAAVPRNRIKYIFFEDMFHQDRIDELCRFLGVGSFAAPVGRVTQPGRGKHLSVDDGTRVQIARALKPTYDELLGRYGDDLPKKWKHSLELLDFS